MDKNNNSITISNNVIATIANIAASKVQGVKSVSKVGLADIIGLKNLTKGVVVEINENIVNITLNISVEYGCKIDDISKVIQNDVKDSVESMVGLKVNSVNINIVGVEYKK